METLTVNEKGQITIPSAIRKQLGIRAGSELRVFADPSKKLLHLTPVRSAKEAFGILPKPKKELSIEAMNESMQSAVANEVVGRKQD